MWLVVCELKAAITIIISVFSRQIHSCRWSFHVLSLRTGSHFFSFLNDRGFHQSSGKPSLPPSSRNLIVVLPWRRDSGNTGRGLWTGGYSIFRHWRRSLTNQPSKHRWIHYRLSGTSRIAAGGGPDDLVPCGVCFTPKSPCSMSGLLSLGWWLWNLRSPDPDNPDQDPTDECCSISAATLLRSSCF